MMPTWTSTAAPPGAQPPPPGYSYPIAAPAYTPVQVRQSFGQYPPAPPTQYPGQVSHYNHQANYQPSAMAAAAHPQPEPEKKKIDWPDSVRNYVARSFMPNNMDPSVTRPEMEAKLKETISRANDTGVMYSINWDSMPLPQQMIKEERAKALASQPAVERAYHPASTNPKKRKSSDLTTDDKHSTTAPWHSSNNSRNSLEDRITYPSPDKRQAMDDNLSKSKSQKEKRLRRFDGGYKSTYKSPSPEPPTGPVVGTCQTLEKKYLRLTSAPVPSAVRPEHILRQTLELLKKKWRKESNYSYICDQFKSMRQDLTVQHIKNDFTVSVYEIHARIALEKGDLGEYNQCQTQLRALYQLGLKGNPIEFKAYRILYFIHTANRSALNDALADLTPAEKEARPIKHALDVRSALALGNYHRFFQLYLDTPNMGAYLMDMFVGRERLAALCNICKAYKPDVRLRFITEELGFESDADAAQFIIDHKGQELLEERNADIYFLSGKAAGRFEGVKAQAFRRVDIKGQI
ncbi:GANP domain-containing protein [Pleurostoma richardsiae]|uniref:GANP domain-containing protein n=1 Tax=Pleurostoma richardsiae TaxID=41990 RepID=A0AA38REG8_9PEZI|nr:GANP domain-containing protein [Pleurostoma richardsiae]